MNFFLTSLLFVVLIPTFVWADVIGPRLKFLYAQQYSKKKALFKMPDPTQMTVTLQFSKPVDMVSLEARLPQGVQLFRVNGRPLHSRHVVIAQVNVANGALQKIQALPNLLRIESLWRPHRQPPLYTSRPQIQTEDVWARTDSAGYALTGREVLIADFDTGANFFHPAFYFADGDTFDWSDENVNDIFDAGVDGVDLNGNGVIEANELLQYVQVYSIVPNPGEYNPSIDWLYNDANGNQLRDYGEDAGFDESDPTYGELLFVGWDTNENDVLDPGEKIVALNTCKLRKVYESDGTIRQRGVDLIQSSGDYWSHGTQVCGILAGGIAGIHKMAGVAPDAELLMGVNEYIDDPPFIETMEIFAPWAASEGTDIMLYEDGEWVWLYMDGSSALETMIDDFAEDGIIQIVPAGNLAGGGMITSGQIPANSSASVPFSVVTPSNQQIIWGNFNWQGDDVALEFSLTEPGGADLNLLANGSNQNLLTYQIYSNASRSQRGTRRMDFMIAVTTGALSGTFSFQVTNTSNQRCNFRAYLIDDRSSWSGRTQWQNPDDNATVSWPATADSAITVAAYDPNSTTQELNLFSGRGKRIDGVPLVDIAAPGSYVYSTTASTSSYHFGGYSRFSGTSSAGPHVAGAVALLKQFDANISSGSVRSALQKGADRTGIAGSFPHNSWGYGRLRINDALDVYISGNNQNGTTLPISARIASAPNPFNTRTTIYYRVERAGSTSVKIYNLLGREVVTLIDEYKGKNDYTVEWDGLDRFGEHVASGIYLVVLNGSGHQSSHKIALVR